MVDLMFFAFAMIIAAATIPVLVNAIGANWNQASPLLKAVYVAMPGTIVFGIFSEILMSREIETIRKNQKKRRFRQK